MLHHLRRAPGRSSEVEALFDEDGIAVCTGCMGKVKPDVVLFGEMLPVAAIERARELAENADLMLCVGSSLEVFPAAGLPELTLAAGGSGRDRHPGPDALRRARPRPARRRRRRGAPGGLAALSTPVRL